MATAAVTNTFTAGTTIVAAQVNQNFQDLVGFLNNDAFHKDGSRSMTAGLKIVDGLVTAPGLVFDLDSNTGIYRIAADTMGVATGGIERIAVGTAGVNFSIAVRLSDGAVGAPGLMFEADQDTGLYRVNANEMRFATGGTEILRLGTQVLSAVVGTAAAPGFAFTAGLDMGMFRRGATGLGLAAGGTEQLSVLTTRVVIQDAGNAAVGTQSGALYVSQSAGAVVARLHRASSTASARVFEAQSDVTAVNTVHMFVEADGDLFNTNGTYGTISDARLKKLIEPARRYLADLQRVKVDNYILEGEEEKKLGFVAQEVAEVFPRLVKEGEDGVLAVKTSVFIPMLVTAVQELAERVEALEAEVAELKTKVA